MLSGKDALTALCHTLALAWTTLHPATASLNGYRFVQCTNVHGNNCSLRGATPIGLSVRARVSALSEQALGEFKVFLVSCMPDALAGAV